MEVRIRATRTRRVPEPFPIWHYLGLIAFLSWVAGVASVVLYLVAVGLL